MRSSIEFRVTRLKDARLSSGPPPAV
jgi:hypothetical protein